MQTRIVAAGQGWQWIVEGFRIFRKQPLMWIALIVVMVLIWLASVMVPLIGALAISLLAPVFFAGLMVACRATDQDAEPRLGQLFAAFRTHAAPLVTVGGIYLVGNIIAIGITFGVAGGSALPTVLSKTPGDVEPCKAAARGLSLGVVVGMAVFLPVLMAVWFAPLLVVFHDMPPVEAMKRSASSRAGRTRCRSWCTAWRSLVLWVLASIPLMLGLIVLLPVLVMLDLRELQGHLPPLSLRRRLRRGESGLCQ